MDLLIFLWLWVSFLFLILFCLLDFLQEPLIVLILISLQLISKEILFFLIKFPWDDKLLKEHSQFHTDEVPTLLKLVKFLKKINRVDHELKISFYQGVDFGELQLLTDLFTEIDEFFTS